LLGVGLYFGIIFLYRQYIAPVQVHTIRLDVMEARQAQADDQIVGRLDDLQGRVHELEAQRDADKAALAEVESQLAAAEATRAVQATAVSALSSLQADLAELEQSLAAVETTGDALRADLTALQEAVGEGQSQVEGVAGDLSEVTDTLDALGASLAAAESALDVLTARVDAYGEDLLAVQGELAGENAPAAVRRDLELIKVLELLTRSRLLLVQNNAGLAEADIAAARAALAALLPQAPAYEEALQGAIARLDAALDNLPLATVAAADEIEGAWQVVLAALSEEGVAAPVAEETPTAAVTPEAEETPTAEVTPEAEETPAATATPTPAS
jgi:S-DNA-T family DNA segregation ATPase FtsK/SpoIIIE